MAASTIFAISLSLWSENISTITVLQTKTPFSTSLRVIVVVIIQERQHCATRLFHQTCSHSPKYHSVGLYGIMLQKLETITLITIQKVRRNILNRKVHADYSFRHLRQPSCKFRPINKRRNTTPVKQVNDNVIVPFFYRRARAIFDKIVCVHNVNLVFDKLVITSLFVHAGDLNLVSPYLPRQLRYLAYPIPQDQHIVWLERWDHVRPVPKSKSCLRRPNTPKGFADIVQKGGETIRGGWAAGTGVGFGVLVVHDPTVQARQYVDLGVWDRPGSGVDAEDMGKPG